MQSSTMLLAGDMMQKNSMIVANNEKDHPDDPTALSVSFESILNIWATGPTFGTHAFNPYQSCQDNSIHKMNDVEMEDAVIGLEAFLDVDTTISDISNAVNATHSYPHCQEHSTLGTESAAALPQAIHNTNLVSNGLLYGHMPVMDGPRVQSDLFPECVTTTTHAGHFLQPGSSDVALVPARTSLLSIDLGDNQVSDHFRQGHVPGRMPNRSVPTTSTSRTRRHYATAEDWIAHRAHFTRLYRDQNKTLKEVMSIMEVLYGFCATEKMYKKRIREWHLEKNIKAVEKEVILQHELQNSGLQLGQPMLNGRLVPKQRLDRYDRDRRKGRSAKKYACKQPLEGTLALSFERVSDPTGYRECENVLKCIEHYFDSKLAGDPIRAWKTWEDVTSLASESPIISYSFCGRVHSRRLPRPLQVFESFVIGANEVEYNRHYNGWRIITEGFALMRLCLQREDPSLIRALLGLICNRDLESRPELHTMIFKHTAEISKIVLPGKHPISVVCQLLAGSAMRTSFARPAFQKLSDVLQTRFGEASDNSLLCMLDLHVSLKSHNSFDEAELVLQQYNDVCGRVRARDDPYVRLGILELAKLRCRQTRYVEAMKAITDVLDRGTAFGSLNHVNIEARQILSLLYAHSGQHLRSEYVAWSSLYGHMLDSGPRDPSTIWLVGHYKKMAQRLVASGERDTARSNVKQDYLGKPPAPCRCTSIPRSDSRPSEGRLRRRYARLQQADPTDDRIACSDDAFERGRSASLPRSDGRPSEESLERRYAGLYSTTSRFLD